MVRSAKANYKARSAKLKVVETAFIHESTLFFLCSFGSWGRKVVAIFILSLLVKISFSVQTPTANPAAQAAPSAVVSMSAGLTTGIPSTSA